jgi:hypothetical protein
VLRFSVSIFRAPTQRYLRYRTGLRDLDPEPNHRRRRRSTNGADEYNVYKRFLVVDQRADQAVDSTMLVTLGTLASQHANGTAATVQDATQLIKYAATHPDPIVRFQRSV